MQTSIEIEFSLPMEEASVQLTLNPTVPRSTSTWSNEGRTLTVTIADPMTHDRQYVVAITGRSAQGVQLEPVELRFTTEKAVDVVPPVVSATTPANAATNIPIGAHVSVTFSEPMDPATVTVTAAPSYDFGAATWSVDGRSVTFDSPPSDLSPLTTYVLTIGGKDLAGNALVGQNTVTFTTGMQPDTSPPTVIASVPSNGAMNVAVDLAPTVSFSEPMDPVTTRAAFSVTPPVPGGCTLAFDGTGSILSCQHATSLVGETTYTATVAATATDISGNALGQPFSWTFTTRDTTPPTIVSVTPADSTNNLEPNQTIVVTFSESMNKAATQSALQITSPTAPDNAGSFTWNTEGTVLTFTPTAWPNNQMVQWQVSTAAEDLAGNALAATATYQFKVRGLYTTTILFVEDGYVREDGLFQTNSFTSVGWIKGTLPAALRLRAFFSFDIPSNVALAPTQADVTATLKIHLNNCNTGTHATYGNIYAEGVDYGAMDGSDFNLAKYCATCPAVLVSTSDAPGQRSADISQWVYEGAKQGKTRIGMRMKMGNEGSAPGVDRYARFDIMETNPNPPTRPQVDLTYRIP